MNGEGKEMILVGDIGGTNTRLAVMEMDRDRFRFVAEQRFSSREETGLESVLDRFLAGSSHAVTRACFGVAGPVCSGRCETVNLPWVIDARQIARKLGLPQVGLINDLEANAWGIGELEDADIEVLNPGTEDPRGNRAVVSAGTGLGEAVIFRDESGSRPMGTEGGHSDFAPRNHIEMELLNYLLKKHGRVSVERVLSGRGLYDLYQFLRDTGKLEEPAWLAEQVRREDPPAVISRNALDGKSPICVQALDMFVSIYGAEAGNMALKVMATGGVYIGGGIAPRIIARLKEPVFMNAFTAKGRMKPLLQSMPVRVILNPKAALLGSARYAARM
ncbi:MAG: glucokinase [Thermodesulfobacteriota bacterium]